MRWWTRLLLMREGSANRYDRMRLCRVVLCRDVSVYICGICLFVFVFSTERFRTGVVLRAWARVLLCARVTYMHDGCPMLLLSAVL